ncbi:protein FAM3D-like [Guaruba guarouba]
MGGLEQGKWPLPSSSVAITMHLCLKRNWEVVFIATLLGMFCCLQPLCPISFTGSSISRASLSLLALSAFPSSLISSVKNNIGRGLNIALVNGANGQLLKVDTFDMCSGDINKLDTFLQEIKHGTIVLTASYDDPAAKMNDKVWAHFIELGSSHVSRLGFRDSWVLLGAKGLKNKSPFEEYIKNNKTTNKYDGWPELLEMEGCVPRKTD